MRFSVLGSGSGGNATLVARGAEGVLIDCGLSVRQVEQRLAVLDFAPAGIRAVLLTHEHDDHIAGAAAFSRRYRVPLVLSHGTCAAAGERLAGAHGIEYLTPDRLCAVGAFEVEPVLVPHDAREPCQFVLGDGSHRVGMLTDIGHASPHLRARFGGLDALVLEFNHDPAMLAAGHYPPSLKARIAGPHGHLSNVQAAELLGALDLRGLRHLVAAHLSEKNNHPALVAECLRRWLPVGTPWAIAAQAHGLPWCDLDS